MEKPTLHSLDKKLAIIETKQEAQGQTMDEMRADIKTLLARRVFKFPIKLTVAGAAIGAVWMHFF
jgi:hypothetical protein